jgi:exosome complex exonuclease DIS3/RRP44
MSPNYGTYFEILPIVISLQFCRCSLRGGELRYAFSVIWTLDSEAQVKSTHFCKSLIKSRAALTYQKAQEMVDNEQEYVRVALAHEYEY